MLAIRIFIQKNNFKIFTIFILSAWYISKAYPHYFIFNPSSYGERYWSVHQLLFAHIIAALTALITGTIQFIFKKKPHRINGYIYFASVMTASIASLLLIIQLKNNPIVCIGLLILTILWLTTSLAALITIINKQVDLHKKWATRSYALTLAFTVSRLIESILINCHISSELTISITMTWAGWLIPLSLNEILHAKTMKY